jgi:hypothetical protein
LNEDAAATLLEQPEVLGLLGAPPEKGMSCRIAPFNAGNDELTARGERICGESHRGAVHGLAHELRELGARRRGR